MSASIASNPGVLVYPAGQRLIYSLSTTTTVTADYRYVVQVMEFNTTEIGKFYLTPNTNEKAFFDLSQVLEGRVKRDVVDNANDALWDDTTAFAKSPQNSKGYQIRVGEYDGTTETLNQGNADIYLFDGYEQQRLGLHPGFSDYYATASSKKVWLTDKAVAASGRVDYTMANEDSGLFGFIYNDIAGSAAHYVQQKIYDDSGLRATTLLTIDAAAGSNAPNSDAFAAGGTVVYASLGPANSITRNTWSAYTEWTYIDNTVLNSGSAAISKVLRITRDCRPYKTTPTQMAFSNSVGGYDYFRWDGRRIQSLSKTDKTYRTLQGTWDAATFTIEPTAADTAIFQNEVTERYALTALLDASQYTLLSSAFKSRQTFIKIGTYWLPCKLSENTLKVQSEPMSKLHSVTVTAEILQTVRC